MALLFHQNMKTFGGGVPARTGVFNGAFAAINAATGPAYWAAGFTEIMNAGAPLHGALSGLAQTLDPGLTRLLVIAVGSTLLGTREYVGIAWDPGVLAVQHAGHVLRDPVNRTWVAYDTAVAAAAGGAGAANTIVLPGGVPLGADARGLAYVAGTDLPGNPILIAFIHNMYNLGDKTGAYHNLAFMADAARQAAGGAYAGAEVVVGGDFNLLPRNIIRTRAAVRLTTYAARVGGGVAGAYVNTTLVHPYDFWRSDLAGLSDMDAAVYTQSRVLLGSDHAAVVLTI